MLNQTVLDIIKEYPTNGKYPYYWPKTGSYDGVTQELLYKGVQIAKPEKQKRTYCCGLTFEVYFRAAMKVGIIFKGGVSDLKELKKDWFVARDPKKYRMGPVDALVPRGLGVRVFIDSLTLGNEPKPGDFCQIWRKDKTGHSVIYLGHNKKSITYWSTQAATNGPGKKTELREGGKNPVTEIFIVRANNII